MALALKLEEDNLRLVCQRSVEELHQLFVAWFQGSEARDSLISSLLECLAPDFSHVAPNGQFLQGRSVLIGHLQDKFGCYKNRLFQIEIYDVRLLWHDPTGNKCLCTYEEWQSWLPDNAQQIANTNKTNNNDNNSDNNNDNNNNNSQEGDAINRTNNGPLTDHEEDDDDEEEEVHQFGRLSTCLLERKINPTTGNNGAGAAASTTTTTSSYRWIHVHETWLEAESPQHDKFSQGLDGVGVGDHDLGVAAGAAGAVAVARGGVMMQMGDEDDTIQTGPMESQDKNKNNNNTLGNNNNTLDSSSSSSTDDDIGVAVPPGGLPAVSKSSSSLSSPSSQPPESAPPLLCKTTSTDANGAAAAAATTTADSLATPELQEEEDDDDDENSPQKENEQEEEEVEEGDRHLLMLMSTQSLSRDQMSRQDMARDSLESLGIAFYEMDGANPEERENRNSLFTLSGKWGHYPQFFLVDTIGSTTFWGTWEYFCPCHTEGRLAQEIAYRSSSTSTSTATAAKHGTDVEAAASTKKSNQQEQKQQEQQSRELSSTNAMETPTKPQRGSYSSSSPKQQQQRYSALQQQPPLVPPNSKLLVLISSQTFSSEQSSRQEEAIRILQDLNIPFGSIDGSAKSNREQRNQLFRTSAFWGKYPQFFHQRQEPIAAPQSSSLTATAAAAAATTFWGRWEEFEKSHARNTLEQDLKYVRPWDSDCGSGTAAGGGGGDGGTYNSAGSTSSTTRKVGLLPDSGAVTTSTPILPLSSLSNGQQEREQQQGGSIRIVLLVSNQSLSGEQMTRQDLARKYLKQANLNYHELDGSERSSRQPRNELFKISKLWGRYPQIFVLKQATAAGTTNTTTTREETGRQVNKNNNEQNGLSGQQVVIFWGDWEKIEASHEKGTFGKEIEALVSSAAAMDNQGTVVVAKGANVQQNPEKEMKLKSADDEFLEKAEGILTFENDDDEDNSIGPDETSNNNTATSRALVLADSKSKEEKKQEEDESVDEEKFREIAATVSPIPQDVSSKRHVSSKLLKYAKPLTWENSLVGLSLHGFDIGTSQGPTGDETWYKEVTEALETIAQYKGANSRGRKLALPDMVYPTAHVALEGHGFWLSWDVLDVMEDWARAHSEIPVNSRESNRGVGVLKSNDAKMWDRKQASSTKSQDVVPSSSAFHYDWTFSTPFTGKMEGGDWVELDESGMRVELLTDTSIPILFFDEVTLFEDDLHNNGQVQFTVKLRVMPSCAYVLARLWLCVDNVVIRVRETRLLLDFFGMGPAVYRDVTWRECYWDSFKVHKLPTDVESWHFDGKETQIWQNRLRQIPEVDPPEGIMRFATLEPSTPSRHVVKQLNSSVAEALSAENSLELGSLLEAQS